MTDEIILRDRAWLDAAQDNFRTALTNEDVEMAKAVIGDTFDAGYSDAARTMVFALRSADIKVLV